jgi:hypothetical protein
MSVQRSMIFNVHSTQCSNHDFRSGSRVLIFNQQGHRESVELLQGLFNAIKSQGVVKFDHVIFCPTVSVDKRKKGTFLLLTTFPSSHTQITSISPPIPQISQIYQCKRPSRKNGKSWIPHLQPLSMSYPALRMLSSMSGL